jgi:predicted DNA-binding transcriptional regulator AlpA
MKKPTTEPPMLLSRNDLAHHLRVSERQLDTLRTNGALPEPLILGTSPRWSRKQIENWIESQHANQNSETTDTRGCGNVGCNQHCKVACAGKLDS